MEAIEKNPGEGIYGDCSLVPERAKLRDGDGRTLREETKAEGLHVLGGLVENTRENGVTVSINGKELLGGGVAESDKTKVVEAEISVGNSFGAGDVDVLGGKEGCLGDSEINGASSLLKMREYGERESVKGLRSVLGVVGKKEDLGIEKKVSGGGICSGEGVSVVVDICGERGKTGREDSGDFDEKEENGDSLNESGKDLYRKIGEMSESKDGKGEEIDDEDYEFRVGDFVWGKIRSHPWWPGQIYDSSDASDFALMVKQKSRLLVAYYGDGTFAWCHPSQLKPFEVNFEEMSKMSSSKIFINAVQNAVDEIGRRVESMMTCSCVPKENMSGLGRELAVNAGIKEGVLVPEGGIRKLSSSLFEPAGFLAEMKHLVQVASVTNLLEFGVLKSQLSAFYQAKGGYQLPIYYEPQPILGLEDDLRDWMVISDHKNAVEVPSQGPIEEGWLSSPEGLKLRGCSGVSEDRLYQRRKQKSIAEIMEEDMNAQVKNEEGKVARAGTNSGKKPSSSRREKRKGSREANGDIANMLTSNPKRRRKVTELSGSHLAIEGQDSSVENHGSGAEEEIKKAPSSRGRKKNKDFSGENDGGGGKEETKISRVSTARTGPLLRGRKNKDFTAENDSIEGKEDTHDSPLSIDRKNIGGLSIQIDEAKEQIDRGPLSRERKKSKYLSPPYTNPNIREIKSDVEAESLKVSSQARLGERMNKADDHLNGSPPILKSGGGHETVDNSSTQKPKEDQSNVIDPTKVKAPANKVLSEIRSVALHPQCVKENSSVNMVEEFLSMFRSSIYRNGSNYKMYNKHQPAKRRKLVDSEPESSRKGQNQTDQSSPGRKSQQEKIKQSEETKSEKPKLKQAAKPARESVTKTNDLETNEKASSAEIFVTFGPGSSLPSKDDIIKIYNKFGPLNKKKTEMFYNNFCARVVFKRSTDAEEAFSSSQNISPFGASTVSFRLRYLPAALKIRELKEVPDPKPSPLGKEGKRFTRSSKPHSLSKEGGKTPREPSASQSAVSEASELNYIRKKLEMMTSMLETSDGRMSREMKSKLEVEMKGLLEKLSMVGSSSS